MHHTNIYTALYTCDRGARKVTAPQPLVASVIHGSGMRASISPPFTTKDLSSFEHLLASPRASIRLRKKLVKAIIYLPDFSPNFSLARENGIRRVVILCDLRQGIHSAYLNLPHLLYFTICHGFP